MKRLTTAGFTAAALFGAMIAGNAWAQQTDADAQLQLPRSPEVNAEADAEAQRDGDSQRGARSDADGEVRGQAQTELRSGQFVQRSDGQLQIRDAQGQVVSQRLADDAVVVLDGREVQWSEVRQGQQLRFQAGSDGMITRVTVVGDADVAQAGQAPRAGEREGVFLGVHITESPTTGVYVREVMPGGPAERSGIQARDYILTVNGEKITSPDDFDQKMADLEVGQQAQFEVWRNQQKQPVTVQLQGQQDQQFAQGQRGQLQQDRRAAFRPEDQQQGRARAEGRAWLGVQLQEIAPAGEGQVQQQGVRITGVYPSGPAARYGLRDGDLIVRIADQEVTSADQMAQLIARQEIGESVPVVVRRGEEDVTIEVVLADRSDFFFDQGQFQQEGAVQGQRSEARFGDFPLSDVPEHAMMLEQHRRFAEQNERTHQMLFELQEEVRQLRQQLNGRNNNANNAADESNE